MIKKLFGKFLKLPFLLLIVALTGVMVWEATNLANKYANAEKLKEEIDYEYYGNGEDKYYKLNEELLWYLESVLSRYEEYGVDGIHAYYENICRPYGYRLFEIALADDEHVYDSVSGTVIENNNFEDNHDDAITTILDTPTEARILRATEMYKCDKYGWKAVSLYDYLDEQDMSFLRQVAPELTIRVCATNHSVNYYYQDLEATVIKEKEKVDSDVEAFISKAIVRYIAYVVGFVLLWILEFMKLKKKVNENEKRGRVERINSEITLVALVTSVFFIIQIFVEYFEFITYGSGDDIQLLQFIICAAVPTCAAVLYGAISVFVKKLYRGCVLADSFIVKYASKICVIAKKTYNKENYGSSKDIKKLYIRKVCMDIAVTVMCGFSMFYMWNNWEYDLALIGIAVYIFYIYKSIKEYKYLRLFNKVNQNIDYIYNGWYEYVDRTGRSEIMMKLSNLSEGFERSVAKQIEAEKLQVELITNVSHDLKTPLTSVISYVDLLSKEELPPVASDYVKILVDKSDRLKDIVSDVFDLAKAASGEEIQLENLDGIILVNQVISDMSDAIADSEREIKLKIESDAAPITANGQKLYRVFQNVIDNALKYSMPGTRIFINAFMEGNEFVFTIKNVSELEIDFTEEEILSRFVRGDKSRNSEGNGLGLSIAKSFTEQCGGRFAVEIDDDMFKVIIRLR